MVLKVKDPPANVGAVREEEQVRSLGQDDPLEEEMATHCIILDWRIPWREEPGGPQSIRVARGGHNLVTKPPPPLFKKQIHVYTI